MNHLVNGSSTANGAAEWMGNDIHDAAKAGWMRSSDLKKHHARGVME